MIAKNIVIQGRGYVKVSLNKEETEEAMQELLEFNMNELERVGKFANTTEEKNILFEKQGISAYTFLQAKLDDKIEELRKKG